MINRKQKLVQLSKFCHRPYLILKKNGTWHTPQWLILETLYQKVFETSIVQLNFMNLVSQFIVISYIKNKNHYSGEDTR